MWLGIFTCFTAYSYGSAAKAEGQGKVVEDAVTIIKELKSTPDKGIPDELFARCEGLAVFPSVYKAGFFVGASYGKGLMAARDPRSGEWQGPIFLQIKSGSFGYQIGVQATDLILLIMNQRGINSLLNNNLTLGGDISISAGPVGRKVKAGTDATLKAEVYSYSRSKGFFAGLSLEGAYLHHDYKANELFYGGTLTPEEIMDLPRISMPEKALKFLAFLDRNCP
jgi:lipid-binding SYLF domain-containing protein